MYCTAELLKPYILQAKIPTLQNISCFLADLTYFFNFWIINSFSLIIQVIGPLKITFLQLKLSPPLRVNFPTTSRAQWTQSRQYPILWSRRPMSQKFSKWCRLSTNPDFLQVHFKAKTILTRIYYVKLKIYLSNLRSHFIRILFIILLHHALLQISWLFYHLFQVRQ